MIRAHNLQIKIGRNLEKIEKAKNSQLAREIEIALPVELDKEQQIQLEQGDRVLFYTDGITECMNDDKQFFEEERFRGFIRKNSALEPEVFSGRLIDELKVFCKNDKFNDDLCLLVFDIN